jgi:hypothetical protein
LIEKRTLQAAVAVAALLPVLAGAIGAGHAGSDFISAANRHPCRLSQRPAAGDRPGLLVLIPAIEGKTGRFTLLTALVVMGGLARLLAAIRLGAWTPLIIGPLVMELVVARRFAYGNARWPKGLPFPAGSDHL